MLLRRAKAARPYSGQYYHLYRTGGSALRKRRIEAFGLEMQYEYGVWTPDEVESLKSEIYTITPEDEAELYRLNERFAGNTANSNLVETMGKSLGQNERLWPFMKSGVILPPWKDRMGGSGGGFAMSGYGLGPGFALVCVDYSKILNQGANVMIAEAKEQLKNLRYEQPDILEKRDFWEGVVLYLRHGFDSLIAMPICASSWRQKRRTQNVRPN